MARRPATAGVDAAARHRAGTEFITFSLSESEDVIRAFAGDDIETAVYYPEDDRFLIEKEPKVAHFEGGRRDPAGRLAGV